MKYYSPYLAQAYGEGNYGENAYSSCTSQQVDDGTCAAAGGTSGNGSGGGLADSGIAVAAFVTLACLAIFIGLLIRFWRRKPVLQEVPVEEEPYVAPLRDEQER
jgi:hypothetical protein